MNPRHIWADLIIFGKGYIRNPAALFFSLAFPIILIALFGLIFSAVGSTQVTLYSENLDGNSAGSQQFITALDGTGAVHVQLVNVSTYQSQCKCANFSRWLAVEDHPVGLIIPAGFGGDYLSHTPVNLTVFTDPQDQASSGIVLGVVSGVANGFNLQAAHGTDIIGLHQESVGSATYVPIDYLVPGLIGFTILTSPMFALVDISASYRKDGLFRELSLTPLTKSEWLVAKVLWYVGLSFLSAGIMIAAGIVLFGAHVTLTVGVLPFLVLGPLFFVSLGMLAGIVARSPESAAVIGNVITFPMMFLSGTFFPVSGFPSYLQSFAHILPLYYVIDGMDQVMLYANPAGAVPDVIVVLIGAVVVFTLAVTLFKWRDD
ncbi:MAG: ABC transporter permease [Thermoplasmata archaeon]|nr:ABC transporter permease [Thermoplasmata archaeon]